MENRDLGSLVVGVNVGVFKRIKEHPGVFTFGVAETAIGAVGATYCAKVIMQNHKMIFPALAGVFLA